jgi:hypothetical protein
MFETKGGGGVVELTMQVLAGGANGPVRGTYQGVVYSFFRVLRLIERKFGRVCRALADILLSPGMARLVERIARVLK